MNTDVFKISKIYTNQLVHIIINSSIKQFQRLQWYPHLRVYMNTYQQHMSHLCLSNNPMLDNHFINLLQRWIPNQRLSSSCYVLLNQSTRKLEHAVSCGQKIPKRRGHTKINEHVKSAFYNFILYCPQFFSLLYPMIVSKLPLMVKQYHSQFQFFYYRYQSEICIIAW